MTTISFLFSFFIRLITRFVVVNCLFALSMLNENPLLFFVTCIVTIKLTIKVALN